MKNRREQRISVSVPLRVWGMDVNGKPFSQAATTLDITRTGARIGGLTCRLQQGDTIGIQHGQEKARFRVVWAGKPGGAEQGQAGVYCTEPGKYIWGVALSSISAPGPSAPPKSVYSDFNPPTAARQDDDRRAVARQSCSGTAKVVNLATGFTTWGKVTDINQTGCYVETRMPLPTNTKVDAFLTVLGGEIHCAAEVRVSHPAGMGLLFVLVSRSTAEQLAALTQNTTPPGEQEKTGKAEPQEVKHAPAAREGTVAQPAGRIDQISEQLGQVEAKIAAQPIALDPRILGELRRIMNHARETAAAVQQFLDSDKGRRDSDELVAIVDQRRIRLAIELIRELVLDVDSQFITIGTEGLAELMDAVAHLNKRLASLSGTHRTEWTEMNIPPGE